MAPAGLPVEGCSRSPNSILRKTSKEGCQRLAEELSRRSVPDIIGFAERHAEALDHLDQKKW